jgi:hypothetical protein
VVGVGGVLFVILRAILDGPDWLEIFEIHFGGVQASGDECVP